MAKLQRSSEKTNCLSSLRNVSLTWTDAIPGIHSNSTPYKGLSILLILPWLRAPSAKEFTADRVIIEGVPGDVDIASDPNNDFGASNVTMSGKLWHKTIYSFLSCFH